MLKRALQVFCGYGNGDTTIENSYNVGNITATGEKSRGGYAFGIAERGTITKCYNTGNITATCYVFGIGGTSVTDCFNTGDIEGNGTMNGYKDRVAGISDDISERCYNTGKIIANGNYAGGISAITGAINCYNTGEIYGVERVGGISGHMNTTKTSNSYNIGKVTGTNWVGGIIGYRYRGDLLNNYYLDTVAEFGEGLSSSNENAEPLAESSMKGLTNTLNEIRSADGTVTGTQDVWKSDIGINNGYPILSWQTDNDKFNLINGDNAFVEDTEGINGGYPILAWQVENSK